MRIPARHAGGREFESRQYSEGTTLSVSGVAVAIWLATNGCSHIIPLTLARQHKAQGTPPVDWRLVDLPLRRARELLVAAREQTDFRYVANQCGEVCIALVNAVEGQQPEIEPQQAMGLLLKYIPRHVGADAQKLAEAALELVIALHKSSNDKRSAALCVEATNTLVKVLGVQAGHGDHTVAELIEKMVGERQLRDSHKYGLQRLAGSQLAQKAAQSLRSVDILNHCQHRKAEGASPATIYHDVVLLRGVLKAARDDWRLEVSTDPVDEAKGLLGRLELVGKSTRRTQRPRKHDLERLLTHFREQDKHPNTVTPMAELAEYAMWSGRRIMDICNLKWDQIDYERRTYRVNAEESFPLLGPVWTIIQRQPRTSPRIFPYVSKTASQRYTKAKKKLGIADLRLNDLRLEAAIRLREVGHTVEDIAKVIGRKDLNTLREDLEKSGAVPRDG